MVYNSINWVKETREVQRWVSQGRERLTAIWQLKVAVYEVLQADKGATHLGVSQSCHGLKSHYQYSKVTNRRIEVGQTSGDKWAHSG